MDKPVLLFVFEHKYEKLWRDGLWATLEALKIDFNVIKINLATAQPHDIAADFILGWGAFGSKVDKVLRSLEVDLPIGLCLAGNVAPIPEDIDKYSIIFYETDWAFKNYLKSGEGYKPKFVHAFGINTDIYQKTPHATKIWDWLTVGSFSLWKRQSLIQQKEGNKLAIGEIQKENYSESLDIIANLLIKGVAVSDMVDPETLVKIYNASRNVGIFADTNGGGERSVLEARACGIPVVVEEDNPKLKELLTSPIYSHNYFANQIKQGVIGCL